MRKWMNPKQKGSALFVAIMFSFIGLLIIAGLVAVWYRLTYVIFPVKTYSSVREAAAGGVEMVATYIESGGFYYLKEADCTDIKIKYRLVGFEPLFDNPVRLCFLGSGEKWDPRDISFTPKPKKALYYGFNSTAYGPNNVKAYIEAVYEIQIGK